MTDVLATAAAALTALDRFGSEALIAVGARVAPAGKVEPGLLDRVQRARRQDADLAHPGRLFQLAADPATGMLLAWCKLGLACGFPEHARGQHVLELKQLYTAPEATGQGLGAALMEWAMAEFAARGADEVQLSVWSGNAGAQRFYARYGFEKVADVTFRVGEQLDEEFLFARMM